MTATAKKLFFKVDNVFFFQALFCLLYSICKLLQIIAKNTNSWLPHPTTQLRDPKEIVIKKNKKIIEKIKVIAMIISANI